jgi:hypothetical protein
LISSIELTNRVPPRRIVSHQWSYWLNRLAPLVGEDVHFACANRIGEEDGITFRRVISHTGPHTTASA